MVQEPVLAAEVGEHGVVAGAHPAIAIHADDGRAADAPREQRDALAIDERSFGIVRSAGENRIASEGTLAAVRGRPEQVIPAVMFDYEGGLVAVSYGDLRLAEGI